MNCSTEPLLDLTTGCAGTKGWNPYQAPCDPAVEACPAGQYTTHRNIARLLQTGAKCYLEMWFAQYLPLPGCNTRLESRTTNVNPCSMGGPAGTGLTVSKCQGCAGPASTSAPPLRTNLSPFEPTLPFYGVASATRCVFPSKHRIALRTLWQLMKVSATMGQP